MATQLAERHEKVLALVEHVAERQRAVDSLGTQLRDSETKLKVLADHVSERERAVDSLANELAQSQNKVMALTTQPREAELGEKRNMLSRQLLKLYGKLKYPYLLPLYRLLRLASHKNEH